MKKTITEELKLNKNLVIDEKHKKVITDAEGGRYAYFDFTKDKIQEIAKKDLSELKLNDTFYLVQALFPEYLISSGLFDCFLMFKIKNGVRLVQIVGKYEDIKEICTKGIVLNIAYNPLDKTMTTKVFDPSEYEISYCFAKDHIVAVPYVKVELYDKKLVVYNTKNAKTRVFEFNKFNVNTLGGWFVFDKNNRHGKAQKGY